MKVISCKCFNVAFVTILLIHFKIVKNLWAKGKYSTVLMKKILFLSYYIKTSEMTQI